MPYHIVWEIQVEQVRPQLLAALITCPDVLRVAKIDDQHLQVFLVEGRAHADIEGWEDLIMEPSGYDVWSVENGVQARLNDREFARIIFERYDAVSENPPVADPPHADPSLNTRLGSARNIAIGYQARYFNSVQTVVGTSQLDEPRGVGQAARVGGQTIGIITEVEHPIDGHGHQGRATVQLFSANQIMSVPTGMIDGGVFSIGARVTLSHGAAQAVVVSITEQGGYAEVRILDSMPPVTPQPNNETWRARALPETGAGSGGDKAAKRVDPPTQYDHILENSDDEH